MPFCTRCGKSLADPSRFCVGCGEPVASPADPTDVPTAGTPAGSWTPPNRPRNWWAAAALALVITLVAVTVIGKRADTPAARTQGLPLSPTTSSPTRPAPVALPLSSWSTVGQSTLGNGGTDDSFLLSSDQTYWAGAYASPAVGCDYLLTGSARVVNGSGYGFSVRASLAEGTPTAQAFQYDPGAGGYRNTQYPNDGGVITNATTDNNWHSFSFSVRGTDYEVFIDGVEVATGTTALSCGGIFLRQWSGMSEFKDVEVAADD